MKNITPAMITEFQTDLVNKGLKPKTVNNCVCLLKSIFNFGEVNGMFEKNPARHIKKQGWTTSLVFLHCTNVNIYNFTSQMLYGFQKDERSYICQTVLNNVKLATGGLIAIITDAKTAYKTYVSKILPKAFHVAYNNEQKEFASRQDEYPLWWVNQACAANRHDLSRMRRRSCVTTKDIHELRRHLWLYVAHRNKYDKDLLDPFFDAIKFKSIKDSVVKVMEQPLVPYLTA